GATILALLFCGCIEGRPPTAPGCTDRCVRCRLCSYVDDMQRNCDRDPVGPARFQLGVAGNARSQPIDRRCAAYRGGHLSVDAVKARLPCPMCIAAAISPPPLAPWGVRRVAHGHRSRRILCRLLLDVDGTL